MRSGLSLGAATLSVCALAGCWDGDALTEPLASPAVQAVHCRADVTVGTLTCGSPTVDAASGPQLAITLGGQDLYVRLASSNVSYDGSDVFQADVTIRSLIAQPLGTLDGTTLTGIKVFFHSGPVVTSGDGSVTVANADGTGTFTGVNQPYFEYNTILERGETSASKTWQWSVPPTVATFEFSVLVNADIPHEQGVLQWSKVLGSRLWDVWGSSPTDVFAVSGDGGILHYDGSGWVRQAGGNPEPLYGVWGSSSTDIFAVGSFGTILRYNGDDVEHAGERDDFTPLGRMGQLLHGRLCGGRRRQDRAQRWLGVDHAGQRDRVVAAGRLGQLIDGRVRGRYVVWRRCLCAAL